ncbi:hypothetical protein KP509_16G045000 [Ceratopteris richardii]|uniref:PROP1-like PPR domain-containing protein n=1 Tax=Ceratopteris richardii TaxID=49495 RepID=A0A8T2T0D6_CERRI|nr:hypothetical protein KP509_16G045000 [Ceratopteris richardii]
MIATYTQHGQQKNALDLFRQVQKQNMVMDSVTYINLLSLCANLVILSAGEQIHNHIVCIGMEWKVIVGTAIVNMYGKSRKLDEASSILSNISKDDVNTWNAIVSAYVENEQSDKALILHDQMLQEGVLPNKAAVASLLTACASEHELGVGKRLHTPFISINSKLGIIVGSALTRMYGEYACLQEAYIVFDEIHERDLIAWTTMISLHAHQEHHDKACSYICSCNTQQLSRRDKISFLNILCACATDASIREGQKVHGILVALGMDSDSALSHALITMFGKCGSLTDARKLFDLVSEENVITWNATIAGYTLNRDGHGALLLFEQMQDAIVPDNLSFVSTLTACSHAGLVEEG